ncbi:hypothetical protein HYT02_04590 [Candidatus Gottesmanbacteria bacterium]|nr:hypothetical protein [Candidatus Gottesmanbacteria bacterium]
MPRFELFVRRPQINMDFDLQTIEDASIRLWSSEMVGNTHQEQMLGVIKDILIASSHWVRPDNLTSKPSHEARFNNWDKSQSDKGVPPNHRNILVQVGKRNLLNMHPINISHTKIMSNGVIVTDSFDFQANLPDGYYLLTDAVSNKLAGNIDSKVSKLLKYLKGACKFNWRLTRTVAKPEEDDPVVTDYFIDPSNPTQDTIVLQKYRVPLRKDVPAGIPIHFRLHSDGYQGELKIYKNTQAEESDNNGQEVIDDEVVLLHYNLSLAEEVSGFLWQAESKDKRRFTQKVNEGLELKVPICTNDGEIFFVSLPSRISRKEVFKRLKSGGAALTELDIKSVDQL